MGAKAERICGVGINGSELDDSVLVGVLLFRRSDWAKWIYQVESSRTVAAHTEHLDESDKG